MDKISAVLFDLDGTLIDTEKYYQRVWPEACAHFGYMLTKEQTLSLRSLGRPFAPERFKEWFGESFDYDKVRSYRKELFEKCVRKEGIEAKRGARELISSLKNKGIVVAIATATDVERASRYLELAGLSDLFDTICSAADAKEGKPSPDVYLEACRQLGFAPENCIAVEDSPNGIRSAYAAGCKAVLIPDVRESEPEVEAFLYGKFGSLEEMMRCFL